MPPAGKVERLSIYEALHAVMEDVQAIGKGDTNKTQGFNYRGIDTTINAVGPAFRTHRVVCVPVDVSYDDERYETKKGAYMRGVTVKVTWRFTGPDGSTMDAMTLGEAADAGDKGIAKAMSVAYRILLLQALCIPTGDEDPDSQSHERAQPRRQEGPPPIPAPTSWGKLEAAIKKIDNADEAWALFQAFLRAAAYHQYGEADQKKLDKAQRDWLWQKAVGAYLWIAEHVEPEGPGFYFYDEALQRQGWAHVLEGHALEIPDYEPPAVPASEELDAEAAAAAESDYA